MANNISEALLAARGELGMLAGEFARLLQRNPSTLAAWCYGVRTPPRPQLFHIIECLGSVDPDVAARFASRCGIAVALPQQSPAQPQEPLAPTNREPTTPSRRDPTPAIVSALFAACERLETRPSA